MGQIRFYEGNGGTQDIVGTLDDSSEQHINFKNDKRFTNDEARSMGLYYVKPGTIIRIYDDSKAKTNDDWAEIEVKRVVPNIIVPTFEMNLENDDYRIKYYRRDNLDGKVSHVKVFPGNSTPEITVIEKIYQGLASYYGNWPAKNGTAYEYNTQGSNYRVYRPDISSTGNSGYYVSLKLDHIRGWASDDHAKIMMDFDSSGMILKAGSEVQIANDKIFTNTLNVLNDLPPEQRSNKYVAIATTATKLFDAIYADMLALGESGGRLYFPEVIKHNMNQIGNVITNVL